MRISCAGDSITFGFNATVPEFSYPSALARMLPKDSVCNFGSNGATMTDDMEGQNDRAYILRPQYAASLKSDPDVVVLMLGSNDANPTLAYCKVHDGQIDENGLALYERCAKKMIAAYQALSTHPKVYFCLAPAMYRKPCEKWDKHYISCFRQSLPALRMRQKSIAAQTGCVLVDTYTPMDDPSLYSDGLHPNNRGYQQLAEIIRGAIA